jgi:hypothetical protein
MIEFHLASLPCCVVVSLLIILAIGQVVKVRKERQGE